MLFQRLSPLSKHFFVWQWKPYVLSIGWFILLSAAMLAPAAQLPEPEKSIPFFDKIVHALLFGGLVFWVFRDFVRTKIPKNRMIAYVIVLFLGLFLYALLVEHLQTRFLNRDGNSADVAADFIGMCLGLGMALWAFRASLR